MNIVFRSWNVFFTLKKLSSGSHNTLFVRQVGLFVFVKIWGCTWDSSDGLRRGFLCSFVGQTRRSGYREDFVTDQKFRVGRPGAAVFSHVNSNFNGKCILRIPLSSDFLQIIGRKQTDSRIQKSGLDSKGLSAIESILPRAKIFCVSEPGKGDFSGEMFDWVVEFAGRLVAVLVLFLYFWASPTVIFKTSLSRALNRQNKHRNTNQNTWQQFHEFLFHIPQF